jgi:hypothetical protein
MTSGKPKDRPLILPSPAHPTNSHLDKKEFRIGPPGKGGPSRINRIPDPRLSTPFQ